MITNFEDITSELTEKEQELLPVLVKGFRCHTKENPIKAPDIVRQVNVYFKTKNSPLRLTEPKLRKCCNYIRSKSLLPLIATSEGYYVSYDKDIVYSQIQSLRERASSINSCATGLQKFI